MFSSRLEVVFLTGRPTKADVSILPMDQNIQYDPTLDIVSNNTSTYNAWPFKFRQKFWR